MKKRTFNILASILILASVIVGLCDRPVLPAQPLETIQVTNQPWGVSTQYIGAVEGNVNFDIKDLQDLGINTYRIYGGMSRWEAQDDDGKYGWPSIAEIKANPDIINWDWWDEIMTNPPKGSDYWWSETPGTIWQGSAREMFGTLKHAKLRTVLTIRNVDAAWNPSWALQLNPPRTEEDWNEWWEHVFATVYWLNVRNDYQVDDFEIHNEPNHRPQGWGGTQADYFELVKVAKDAIEYVYSAYLPGRTYHIHAPVVASDNYWVADTLQQIPTYFDSVNVHDYNADISYNIQQVHELMKGTPHANSPVWLGEWGTYETGYENLSFALNLIKNIIRGSQPGDRYIYGSHLFSLYDWGAEGGFKGLIDANGERQVSYYALRMGIRALQGGRPTFVTTASHEDLMTIATKDLDRNIYLLAINDGRESHPVDVNLSELLMNGTGTLWEFSAEVMDEVVGNPVLENGRAVLSIPAQSAILVQLKDDN